MPWKSWLVWKNLFTRFFDVVCVLEYNPIFILLKSIRGHHEIQFKELFRPETIAEL